MKSRDRGLGCQGVKHGGNYYNPAHVLGPGNSARAVVGAANTVVLGYSHVQMPLVPKIIAGTLAATKGL